MHDDTILVVDDNPASLKLARVLLERTGYKVRTATDAREALELLEDCLPRLILLDMQLPGMDGYELTRRLKADQRTQTIPIVALTAYAMMGDAKRAGAAGCDDYVTKPLDTQSLPKVIAKHLMRTAANTDKPSNGS